MEEQPSVWRIALGTMVGNIGCFVAYMLLLCMIAALLAVLGGPALNNLFPNIPRGLQ